jgi:hypothetical protein
MQNILIACQTISNEVEQALSEINNEISLLWIESGLHSYPDSLRNRLQEEINKLEGYDNILMAFGSCGNSLLGLTTTHSRLIVPKVDDCISILLGSYARRHKFMKEKGTYFLTQGWLEYENNINKEYEHCVERHGEEKTNHIFKIMLENYRRLMVIDTGAYCLDTCLKKTIPLAEKLGLEHQITKGSTKLIKQLITGPWDEKFAILQPGEILDLNHFGFGCTLLPGASQIS